MDWTESTRWVRVSADSNLIRLACRNVDHRVNGTGVWWHHRCVDAAAWECGGRSGWWSEPSICTETEPSGGCAVSAASEQPPDDAGAVDVGEGDGGGAVGGAAKRLGVFEAGGGSGHDLELCVRGRGGGGFGSQSAWVAVDAAEILDCGVRFAVHSAHCLCVCWVPAEAPAGWGVWVGGRRNWQRRELQFKPAGGFVTVCYVGQSGWWVFHKVHLQRILLCFVLIFWKFRGKEKEMKFMSYDWCYFGSKIKNKHTLAETKMWRWVLTLIPLRFMDTEANNWQLPMTEEH